MKWMAHVKYKNNPPQVHLLEELEELDQLIESGPCFYDVEFISITINDDICKACDDHSGCEESS